MFSLPLLVAKTLENDIFLLFLILIPTKSVTFAHCGLVFVDKASTDGGEQKPSSPTGGLPTLQPSNPYLQKAAIQPYRRPAQSAAKQTLSAESYHPALPEACPLCSQPPQPNSQSPQPAANHPNTATKHPNPTAKHPNPAAEATDAAEAIIRDYGITN